MRVVSLKNPKSAKSVWQGEPCIQVNEMQTLWFVVLSYVVFVLLLYVLHLSFFDDSRRLCCGISWVSSFLFVFKNQSRIQILIDIQMG